MFFFCKDNASRTQSSLLEIAEAKLILCKDNASRTQSSLLEIAEAKLILYKDNGKSGIHGVYIQKILAVWLRQGFCSLGLKLSGFRSSNGLLLCDACLLSCKFAQVVKLCATHFTMLVYLNAVDVRRLNREDTLNTYCS